MNKNYHIPVLHQEAVAALVHSASGVYADVTLGGGGHASGILERLDSQGRLVAFDQDQDAIEQCPIQDDRFLLVHHNFRYVYRYLDYLDLLPIQGVLADLGVSSHHFDVPERGFSYRSDALLDMRMNAAAEITAKDVVNDYADRDLYRIMKYYGEIKNPGKATASILEYRSRKVIATVSDLLEAVQGCLPKKQENKYLSQLFQSFRIEVNQELEVLKELLLQMKSVLSEGGRLVVISYHSLEDRLVKNFMKSGNFDGDIEKDFYGHIQSPFRPVGKVIIPGQTEIDSNVRSRSARLRVAERIITK